eukprot:1345329-Prorocentrum_lima.AAC.1
MLAGFNALVEDCCIQWTANVPCFEQWFHHHSHDLVSENTTNDNGVALHNFVLANSLRYITCDPPCWTLK